MLPCNNSNENNKKNRVSIIVLVIFLIAIIFLFLYSWKCQLEPELVAIVRLDPAYFPGENIYEPWHSVYEAYDNYPGTWIHPYEYYKSRAIDEWPEMDLENYTYIITYCQKIESLSYYPFRENNTPTYTGAKEAQLILGNKTEPLTIYIYQVPKMRINNPELRGQGDGSVTQV